MAQLRRLLLSRHLGLQNELALVFAGMTPWLRMEVGISIIMVLLLPAPCCTVLLLLPLFLYFPLRVLPGVSAVCGLAGKAWSLLCVRFLSWMPHQTVHKTN